MSVEHSAPVPSLGHYFYHRHVPIQGRSECCCNQVPQACTHRNFLLAEELNWQRLSPWFHHMVAGSHRHCAKLWNHRSGRWERAVVLLFSARKPKQPSAPHSLPCCGQRFGFSFCACQGQSAWLIWEIPLKRHLLCDCLLRRVSILKVAMIRHYKYALTYLSIFTTAITW